MIQIPDNVSFAMSDQVGELTKRLAEVLPKTGYAKKTGDNKHHNYKYASDLDLIEVVRGPLVEAGISIQTSTRVLREETVGKQLQTTIELSVLLLCGDQWILSRHIGVGADTQDKGVYKAVTGAKKYWLATTFLVATGDDPENELLVPTTANHDLKSEKPKNPKAPSKPKNAELSQEAKDAAAGAIDVLMDINGWDEKQARSELWAESNELRGDEPLNADHIRRALEALAEDKESK